MNDLCNLKKPPVKLEAKIYGFPERN